MTKLWDVLVVGGGPAGSRAAEVIAGSGLDVLVVDRKKEIGSPNHCGEGLSDDCLAEIGAGPDADWIVHEVEGSRIHFPNGSWIDFPRRGFSVRRPELDRFLAGRAIGAGAEIRTGVRVHGIEQTNGTWTLSSRLGRFSGRVLLGAGGALCPVAQYLGQRSPRIVASQIKFPAETIMGDNTGRLMHFFHHELYRGGYAWAFPRGNEIAIGAGGAGRPMPMVEHLCQQLGIDMRTRRIVEGGPIPFVDRPLKIVHDRALLCGDAGGFIHPLTKGGIHGAVWSGRLAGEAIVRAFKHRNFGHLTSFDAAVAGHLSRSASQLKIPRAFLRFDNKIINAIGEVMDGRVYTDLPFARFFRVLAKNLRPHLLWGLGVGIAVRMSYRRSERWTW